MRRRTLLAATAGMAAAGLAGCLSTNCSASLLNPDKEGIIASVTPETDDDTFRLSVIYWDEVGTEANKTESVIVFDADGNRIATTATESGTKQTEVTTSTEFADGVGHVRLVGPEDAFLETKAVEIRCQ